MTTDPKRVRVSGDLFHGRNPAGAVYVGRPAPGLPGSRWANPHRVGKPCRRCPGVVHDPADAVAAYAADITAEDRPAIRAELAGQDLACWCKPPIPCHADVLLPIANPKEITDA